MNKAIEVAEQSARDACVYERASDLSAKAEAVARAARKEGQPRAANAALCAAEAASTASCAMDRQKSLQAAQRALACADKVLKDDCRGAFTEDLRAVGLLGNALGDEDPAPPKMLNFVHQQAVHEAGHAVAACVLKVPFDDVRIIYEPELYFSHDPSGLSPGEQLKYAPVYAAGAAAEDLVCEKRREWANRDDREEHAQRGGTDFDRDVAWVKGLCGFDYAVLSHIASLLAEQHLLSQDEVEQALKSHGITIQY